MTNQGALFPYLRLETILGLGRGDIFYGGMGMFAILRSQTNKKVQLVTKSSKLGEFPPDVLKCGPWKIVARGNEGRLKVHYRRALVRDGYCVVDAESSLYNPYILDES